VTIDGHAHAVLAPFVKGFDTYVAHIADWVDPVSFGAGQYTVVKLIGGSCRVLESYNGMRAADLPGDVVVTLARVAHDNQGFPVVRKVVRSDHITTYTTDVLRVSEHYPGYRTVVTTIVTSDQAHTRATRHACNEALRTIGAYADPVARSARRLSNTSTESSTPAPIQGS
jgi:hypothetical protein